MKASELTDKVDLIPTPIGALNEVMGGIATKRITEVAGPWSVGKSTFALQFVARAQIEGYKAYWADAERTFTVDYAQKLGVDCEALEYDKTEVAEDLLDHLEEWARKHKNGVIVIDAIGALMPREELEKGASGRSIGVQARLVGSFCRRIVPTLDEKNHALILCNHTFTDPNTTRLKSSGGMKLEFAKSFALWLRPAYGKPDKRSADGAKVIKYIEAEIKKDKVGGNEGKKVVLELIAGNGFVSEMVQAPEKKKRGRPAKVI
jgi:RecA/RadA recombinase